MRYTVVGGCQGLGLVLMEPMVSPMVEAAYDLLLSLEDTFGLRGKPPWTQ